MIPHDRSPHRLFHVSPVAGISAFKPLTHFGTLQACRDRAASLISQGLERDLTLYHIELTSSRPLAMTDMINPSYSGRHHWIRMIDLLHYDVHPQVLTRLERHSVFLASAIESAADQIQYDDEKAIGKLVVILASKGYDSIVYANRFEDMTSESWMSFRPDQIKVIEASPFREFTHRGAEIQGAMALPRP